MTSYVITYRLVKGSNITASEHDASLHNLDDRTTVLEDTAAGLTSVIGAEIDTNGHLIITLSNSDTIDAGPLPDGPSFADLFIGPWPASTQVYKNQLFTAVGRLYVVLRDHITASTFDPAANDGGGHDYYNLVLDFTSVTGREISDSTFSPDITDVGTLVRLTSSSTCVVTIDPSLDWPDWAEIHFRDQTVGGASFEITSTTAEPATINPQYGSNNVSAGPGSSIGLKKVGSTSDWDIWGRLEAVTA